MGRMFTLLIALTLAGCAYKTVDYASFPYEGQGWAYFWERDRFPTYASQGRFMGSPDLGMCELRRRTNMDSVARVFKAPEIANGLGPCVRIQLAPGSGSYAYVGTRDNGIMEFVGANTKEVCESLRDADLQRASPAAKGESLTVSKCLPTRMEFGQAAANSPRTPVSVPAGPIVAPVWNIGDEWQYAYKSPTGSGTYVWAVSRIDTLDGVQHYVVKVGTREILYRVADLANTLERVNGVVVLRETPSRLLYDWPLTVGKSWEHSHRQERPVERSTLDRNSLTSVEADEAVTVPAGTFRTMKLTWKNKNTNAVIYEMWYGPEVKQWVKIREVLSNGVRGRELIAFKLR